MCTGWEYHAYLLQQRVTTGLTLYEPTDDEVVPWDVAKIGFRNVKQAYVISVRAKRDKAKKCTGTNPCIFKPVAYPAK